MKHTGKTSLSFDENLKIRWDHLFTMQEYHELLICTEIDPELLSLQGFRVRGTNGYARSSGVICARCF